METRTIELVTAESANMSAVPITVSIISLIIAIIGIVAGWKIFKKAGQPGWKILIPIYNAYILFKIVGMNFWGWLCAILATSLLAVTFGQVQVGFDAFGEVNMIETNPFGAVMIVLWCVLDLAMSIVLAIRLAKAFKKGGGFAVGIFLLPYIFSLILAFGSAKYDKKVALARK